MNALGASITAVLAAVVLFGSKRAALLALVAGILYLTQQQALNVAGFNLYAFRLLEIVGLARLLFRGERPTGQLTAIDKLVVSLYGYTVLVYLVRSDEGGQAFQIGTAVDAFLCYFLFRTLISTVADYRWLMQSLSVLLIPYVPLVVSESITHQNPFAEIGGVELIRAGDLWIREGRLRATGTFGHPSLMGTFGGVFLPLYVSLFLSGERRLLIAAGVLSCMALVWASNSGAPATCVFVATVGWMLWPLRRHMNVVRISVAALLILLAAVMKAPIWYLLARVSDITGGGGFHRAVLMDVAFQNIDQWWLAGMPVLATSHWLPYTNTQTGAVDMTNHFLVFGIAAGAGAVLILVAMLSKAFGDIGRAMAHVRESSPQSPEERIFWGIGVMMSVHLFNWFSISYWDQSNVVWFFHLALVGSLTSQVLQAQTDSGTKEPVNPQQGDYRASDAQQLTR
jgi:hypothetical protein